MILPPPKPKINRDKTLKTKNIRYSLTNILSFPKSSKTNTKDIIVKLKDTKKHIPKKIKGNLYFSKLEIIYLDNKEPK